MGVDGGSQVIAAFEGFETAVAAESRQIVAATVRRIHGAARAHCPIGEDPGPFAPSRLRDQIRQQMSRDQPQGAVWVERFGIGGFWGTDNRGLWVEYGTVGHAMPRRGGWQPPIGPRPFMRPAVDAERGIFEASLRAALEGRSSQF